LGTFKKGEVVLFPFPYTNQGGQKLRPCLVLSDEMRTDILLCQITSPNIAKDSYSVDLGQHETENGSLLIDSYIRSNMLFTADKSQIVKKLCRITNAKYQQVVKKIIEIISKK